MLKMSTALRDAMLDTGSFKSLMDGCFLKQYSGATPADADAALGSAVLLCTFTVNGDGTTGLSFAATASGGAITKAAQVWSGTNAASGTVSFWRLVKTGDTGASSTTERRVQGAAGVSGTDLIMTSLTVVGGAPNSVDFATFALPA
jgi:hypothetical protein